MHHSQNNEAEVLLNYFGDFKGVVLDIGANDGITLSNSYDLINEGWFGFLIEPTEEAFKRLDNLYRHNVRVCKFNVGIASVSGKQTIYESANHVPNGSDVGLVSSTKKEELARWEQVSFKEMEAEFMTFAEFMDKVDVLIKAFDFISIDCEGMDLEILHQIDLSLVGCKAICVEHNSNKEVYNSIKEHCAKYGLVNELCYNAENVIFAK